MQVSKKNRNGRFSREKGKRGEREAVRLLRALTGIQVQRVCLQHKNSADIVGLSGFHIEVKNVRYINFRSAWKQASQSARDLVPLLLFKLSGKWHFATYASIINENLDQYVILPIEMFPQFLDFPATRKILSGTEQKHGTEACEDSQVINR